MWQASPRRVGDAGPRRMGSCAGWSTPAATTSTTTSRTTSTTATGTAPRTRTGMTVTADPTERRVRSSSDSGRAVTIRRGQDWGEPTTLDEDTPVFHDDASAAAAVQEAFDVGATLPTIALVGGDLHRTLGSPHRLESDLRAGRGVRFPIDLGVMTFDDGRSPRVFLSSVVAHVGRQLWSGRTVTVMNGSFCGGLDLGPRAHPNDGVLDVVDGTLSRRDARRAMIRAATGHAPSPSRPDRASHGVLRRRGRPPPAPDDRRQPGHFDRPILDLLCPGCTLRGRLTDLRRESDEFPSIFE